MPRILIVDAYPKAGREALAGAGGTEGGELYRRMLARIEPALARQTAAALRASPGVREEKSPVLSGSLQEIYGRGGTARSCASAR